MYDLVNYIKDKEIVERWAEERFNIDFKYNSKSTETIEEILTTLKDNNQSKQIRHYVFSLCSNKNENITAFCDNLLPNYILFSILATVDNKLESIINVETNNFFRAFLHHVEKPIE